MDSSKFNCVFKTEIFGKHIHIIYRLRGTYEYGPRVEGHAPERAVLDVPLVVGDVYLPLPRLVRLEGGEEGAVLLAHGAAQGAARWGVGGDLGKEKLDLSTMS